MRERYPFLPANAENNRVPNAKAEANPNNIKTGMYCAICDSITETW